MSCKQTEFGLNHNTVGVQLVTIIGASIRVAQQLSITVNPVINSLITSTNKSISVTTCG